MQAQNVDSVHPTGDWSKSDTVVVTIPVRLIKCANAKLIERLYLLEIVNQQDSIIAMKDGYINEQHRVITDFQKRVLEVNKVNTFIKEDLVKQKRNNKIIIGSSCGIIVGLIISLLCK